MSETPRRQYSYSTAQSAESTDYVPGKTRNPDRLAMFEGRPGIVIPWQQKVGAVAMTNTFEIISQSESYDDNDLEEIAGLFATVSFGTAFHTFAQRPQHPVMRRHGQLPDMLDRDSKEPIGLDGLVRRAQNGLDAATRHATKIESMVRDGIDPEKVSTKNYDLGRALFNSALTLAAIHHEVASQEGSELVLQRYAWEAAEAASQSAIDITADLGIRPTVAQLVDPSSPYMRYLHDNTAAISQQNFEILTTQVRAAADRFTLTA